MEPPFEIIEHPADIGFRCRGRTREELFANASLAMMSLACDPVGIAESESREIVTTGDSDESLLFAWLAEILAVADAEKMFFRRAEVTSAAAGRMYGRVFGEKYDKRRHDAGTYIKAVTMHQLWVKQSADGWEAQVFLDV